MKTLYFDTTIINYMLDDSKCSEITNKILKKFNVFVSVFNIAEIAANSDYGKRRDLIRFSHKLLNGYRPFDMPHDILEGWLIAYKNGEKKFNCCIGENKNWIWNLLCEAPLKSKAYKPLIELKKKAEKWYQEMHNGGRQRMQEIISKMPQEEKKRVTTSFSSYIRDMYINRTDVIYDFILSYIQNNIKEVEIKTEKEAQQILNESESWRFFLACMGYGIFKRSIQRTKYSKKKNPGSIDTQQSIYLSTCDVFVTDDKEQYKMLRLLSKCGHRHIIVWNYSQFCQHIR